MESERWRSWNRRLDCQVSPDNIACRRSEGSSGTYLLLQQDLLGEHLFLHLLLLEGLQGLILRDTYSLDCYLVCLLQIAYRG